MSAAFLSTMQCGAPCLRALHGLLAWALADSLVCRHAGKHARWGSSLRLMSC